MRYVFPLIALTLGGCSDDAVAPEASAETLMTRGELAVGYQELELSYDALAAGGARTLPTKIWYPATAGGDAATYAVAGIVEIEANGVLDAPPVAPGGPYPLAVYSHGSGGEGLLAYPYAELFASHGWIVVAPNHVGNTALDSVMDTSDPFPRNVINRPADITAVIDWAAAGLPGDLEGQAMTDRVFLFGHSFGAYTTFAAGGVDLDGDAVTADCTTGCEPYMEPGVPEALAADLGDPRIVAIAPQAPALVPFFASGELAGLDIPTMLMSARRDVTTTDAVQSIPAWEGLDDERDVWVELPDGGHYSFVSVCDDLEASLLELFIPTYETDGCGADNTPVSVAVPALAGYVLGFAREHVLGEAWQAILTGEPFADGFVVSTH